MRLPTFYKLFLIPNWGNDYKKNNKKSFANSKNINKFAVMIATSGLHDSFSRIKKLAFAIRHARWNVGNFKKALISE